MTANLGSVRNRLLDSAVLLSRTRGVAGTTVAELLAASGVARRSLYSNFNGGRNELLLTATKRVGQQMTSGIQALLTSLGPINALQFMVDSRRELLASSDFTAGCPIMSAALGGAEIPAISEYAATTFAEWIDMIADSLVSQGLERDAATSLAALVVAGVEGGMAIGVATGSSRVLDLVGRRLAILFENELTAAD